MKILLRILGVILAFVIVALVVFSVIGLDPKQTRAGLWLKGDVQSFPADWTFSNKFQTILVETHPWYLIPHSVTISFCTYQGNLYLHADYGPPLFKPGTFPSGKSWTRAVASNPNVRVKLGKQVFDGKAFLVTDQSELDGVFTSEIKKYPKSPYSVHRPDVFFLRVLPQ